MAVDGTSIKNDIDNNLANKGYRGIRIVNVITALKNLADWVTGSVNSAIGSIGGNLLLQTVTQPLDGLPGTRFYQVVELPAPTGGTFDYADLKITIKQWDNTSGVPLHIRLYVANRGGFYYEYSSVGNLQNGGCMLAYTLADGRTLVYLKLSNAFKVASVRVPSFSLATISPSLVCSGDVPAGTLALSTEDPTNYPPYMSLQATGQLKVKSMTGMANVFPALYSSNTDGLFPAVINEVANNQLVFGSNMVAGYRDMSLINANLAGNGFGFFQMLSINSKRQLVFITGNGDMLIGTTVGPPVEKLQVMGNIQVDGYVRAGGNNMAFKLTGVKSASNLSLKTGRYLELLLQDGTVVKVAEVN